MLDIWFQECWDPKPLNLKSAVTETCWNETEMTQLRNLNSPNLRATISASTLEWSVVTAIPAIHVINIGGFDMHFSLTFLLLICCVSLNRSVPPILKWFYCRSWGWRSDAHGWELSCYVSYTKFLLIRFQPTPNNIFCQPCHLVVVVSERFCLLFSTLQSIWNAWKYPGMEGNRSKLLHFAGEKHKLQSSLRTYFSQNEPIPQLSQFTSPGRATSCTCKTPYRCN